MHHRKQLKYNAREKSFIWVFKGPFETQAIFVAGLEVIFVSLSYIKFPTDAKLRRYRGEKNYTCNIQVATFARPKIASVNGHLKIYRLVAQNCKFFS